MNSVLVLCYPTYRGRLHLDPTGTSVILAPDEMILILGHMGLTIEVVNLSPYPTSLPLMRSHVTMRALDEISPARFDVCWHMFRDPTQPEVMDQAGSFADWFPRARVVNHIQDLNHHYKHRYLPILHDLGIGPRVCDIDSSTLAWSPTEYNTAVSACLRYVRTWDYNNNRGEYRDRASRPYVVTEFLDGSLDARRSFFRVGYAAGDILPGWLYTTSSDKVILKSGLCPEKVRHAVPVDQHATIREAMRRMGIDAAHLEGTYIEGKAMIFDVNPYPTSYGATLAAISQSMCEALIERWRVL